MYIHAYSVVSWPDFERLRKMFKTFVLKRRNVEKLFSQNAELVGTARNSSDKFATFGKPILFYFKIINFILNIEFTQFHSYAFKNIMV